MDFLLHEFCSSPSSEQFGFTEEPFVSLQQQQQDFSENYLNRDGSVLDSQTYFPVTNNTDSADIPCYLPLDSFTPSVSLCPAGMAHVSSGNTDINAGHNLGFYTEVRRDESSGYNDGKNCTERTTSPDAARRDQMDLPDTTNSSPTPGLGEHNPQDVTKDPPSPSERKRKATALSAGKPYILNHYNSMYVHFLMCYVFFCTIRK